jgi:autotransporter-associated beta strand protein
MTNIIRLVLSLLAGGLILFSPSAVRATDGTLLDVSGNWSDTNLWVGGIICDGAGSTCYGNIVSNSTTRTNTLDTSRTIGTFYLDNNGDTRVRIFQGLMGTETITLTGGSITAINGPLVFKCPILSPGRMNLRPWGVGTVVLSATNSWPGDTTITQGGTFGKGSVKIGGLGAIPHGAGNGNVIIDNSGDDYGTLNLLTNDVTINGLSGTGGKVTSTDATAGTTTLTVGDNNANGGFGGTVDDGATRVLALTKIGSGTQILNAPITNYYTYSGPTTVNAGTLQVDGFIGGGVGPTPVTVNGGTLCGNGIIYGSVTIVATGNISAGASAGAGKLTLYSALDMSAPNTTYIWDLGDNSTSNPGVDFDQIVLAAGSADVSDANLNIHFTGTATPPDGTGFWASSHAWLIMSGTVTGNFKNIQIGTNAAGYFYTTVNGSGVTLNFRASCCVPPPPFITTQPTNQTVVVGENATFSVTAIGTLPRACQWRKNEVNLANGVQPSGTTLSGATTTDLTVANVQLNDGGGYTVVVTNAYGSVTSSVAALTVQGRCAFSSGFGFDLSGLAGQPVMIEASTNLTSWSPILTNSLPAGWFNFTDCDSVNCAHRFYRVRLTP